MEELVRPFPGDVRRDATIGPYSYTQLGIIAGALVAGGIIAVFVPMPAVLSLAALLGAPVLTAWAIKERWVYKARVRWEARRRPQSLPAAAIIPVDDRPAQSLQGLFKIRHAYGPFLELVDGTWMTMLVATPPPFETKSVVEKLAGTAAVVAALRRVDTRRAVLTVLVEKDLDRGVYGELHRVEHCSRSLHPKLAALARGRLAYFRQNARTRAFGTTYHIRILVDPDRTLLLRRPKSQAEFRDLVMRALRDLAEEVAGALRAGGFSAYVLAPEGQRDVMARQVDPGFWRGRHMPVRPAWSWAPGEPVCVSPLAKGELRRDTVVG